MADENGKRPPAPVTLNDRPSPADRVKQVQQMQQAMNSQPVSGTKAPTGVARPAVVTTPRTAGVFDVGSVRNVGANISSQRVPTNPEVYAKVQVDPSRLFGGPDSHEIIGCPWKVIDFNAHAPQLFEPQKPLADYTPKVPEKAVNTEHGVLFQVALEPKEKGAQPLRRAVLTNAQGQLTGAECKNAGELQKLLAKAPSITNDVFLSAFGSSKDAKLLNISNGKNAAFSVTVGRGNEMKTVSVNNFGRPVPEGMDPSRMNILVANYFADRFEI